MLAPDYLQMHMALSWLQNEMDSSASCLVVAGLQTHQAVGLNMRSHDNYKPLSAPSLLRVHITAFLAWRASLHRTIHVWRGQSFSRGAHGEKD